MGAFSLIVVINLLNRLRYDVRTVSMMAWFRILTAVFPRASAFIAGVSPFVFLPLTLPVGYVGYKLEEKWSTPKDESGRPSVADLREERLKAEAAKEHFGEMHFKKTIFEKNQPKTERNAFNRREIMKDS